MDSTRTRRLLIVAFVLSLLIHVVIATGVRWQLPVDQGSDVQVVQLMRMHPLPIVRRTPAPTPRPTQAPAPHPRAARAPKHHPRRPHGTRSSGHGAAVVARALPPASPSPQATATPSCRTTEIAAAVASAPPVPQIDAAARGAQTNGVARVQVQLDATGSVVADALVASSGNPALDAIAVEMARTAQYTPARRACKAVASSYEFSVRFSAW